MHCCRSKSLPTKYNLQAIARLFKTIKCRLGAADSGKKFLHLDEAAELWVLTNASRPPTNNPETLAPIHSLERPWPEDPNQGTQGVRKPH